MISRIAALEIANDVGVSSRPAQYYQCNVNNVTLAEGYLYIGYVYATAKDLVSSDFYLFSLNGNIIGKLGVTTNSITLDTSNVIFVVFDDVQPASVGDAYFTGFRIKK